MTLEEEEGPHAGGGGSVLPSQLSYNSLGGGKGESRPAFPREAVLKVEPEPGSYGYAVLVWQVEGGRREDVFKRAHDCYNLGRSQ